jgi:hypothetical protein
MLKKRYTVIINTLLLLVAVASGAFTPGCSSALQSNRPTDEQMRADYEKLIRQNVGGTAAQFTALGGGQKEIQERVEKTKCTGVEVLDSQSGETSGIRFYNAKVRATGEYWNGTVKKEELWMKYEKTDKGWNLKGIAPA